jgi:hypothetical protein
MLRSGTFSRSFGTFSRLSGRAAGILGDRRGIVFPEVEVDDPQLGRGADQFHGAVDAQLVHDAGPVVFDGLGADQEIGKVFLPGLDGIYLTIFEN